MEERILLLWIVCFPGLLSASCSSSLHSSTSESSLLEYPSKFGYPPNSGSLIQPRKLRTMGSVPDTSSSSIKRSNKREECRNGWCSEDGECVCNPCWSGPTCQDYVDRFAPRFLAEEPFFMLDASLASLASASAAATSSQPPTSASTFTETSTDAKKTGYTSSLKTSVVKYDGMDLNLPPSPMPLFRIESADDDLGLTCQLGQVGPAATCPCATPRYKVTHSATTFPSTTSSLHPPSSKHPPPKNNTLMFRADDETGDVFLQDGFTLIPATYYFITLQVAALEVNNSGYRAWKEELLATLYIKPLSTESEISLEPESKQEDAEANPIEIPSKPANLYADFSTEASVQINANSENSRRLNSQPNNRNKPPYSFPSFKSNAKWKRAMNRYKDKIVVEGKPFQRLRRQVKENAKKVEKKKSFETSEVKLFLSRQTEPINSEKMQLGDKIKMQLLILFSHTQSPLDLDVEISALNDEKQKIYCSILSTNVTILGENLEFDKSTTNFNPIMTRSPTIPSGEDTAVWHFKSLQNRRESLKNNGIMIEFELLATESADRNCSGGAACTSPSISPVSLSSESSSPSRSLSETDKNDSSVRLGGVSKGFNNYLIPIQARAFSPPTGHDQNRNDNLDDYDKSTLAEETRILFSVSFSSPLASRHAMDANGTGNGNTHQLISPAYQKEVAGSHQFNADIMTNKRNLQVEVVGPSELHQGEWLTYKINVYHKLRIQGFRLNLKPYNSNDAATRDAISVGDIRMVKTGEDISACSTLKGVQVACKKSIGRKGDWCSIESPLFQDCSEHIPKNNGSDTDDRQEICGGNATRNKNEKNVLEFEGVIYGLPMSSPGTTFSLEAHIYLQVKDDSPKNMPPKSNERLCGGVIIDDQTIHTGEILRRPTKETKSDSLPNLRPKSFGKSVFSETRSKISTSFPLHYNRNIIQRDKLKLVSEANHSVENRARRSINSFNSHKYILNNGTQNHTNKVIKEHHFVGKVFPYSAYAPDLTMLRIPKKRIQNRRMKNLKIV